MVSKCVILEKLSFILDPNDGHYMPFAKAFTLKTTERDRPSLKEKQLVSLSPLVQVYSKFTTQIQWFYVMSVKTKLYFNTKHLQSILEDISYTCGLLFDDLDLPKSLSFVVIPSHQCVCTFFSLMNQFFPWKIMNNDLPLISDLGF